jgi:hypothetical protein
MPRPSPRHPIVGSDTDLVEEITVPKHLLELALNAVGIDDPTYEEYRAALQLRIMLHPGVSSYEEQLQMHDRYR